MRAKTCLDLLVDTFMMFHTRSKALEKETFSEAESLCLRQEDEVNGNGHVEEGGNNGVEEAGKEGDEEKNEDEKRDGEEMKEVVDEKMEADEKLEDQEPTQADAEKSPKPKKRRANLTY
eukprot:sb/3476365/